MDEKPEYWVCIVGPVTRSQLQDGADAPPRGAVQRAVADMTDEWPERCWSGWGCTEEVKDKILEAWS